MSRDRQDNRATQVLRVFQAHRVQLVHQAIKDLWVNLVFLACPVQMALRVILAKKVLLVRRGVRVQRDLRAHLDIQDLVASRGQTVFVA